jgi:hypothetical protein
MSLFDHLSRDDFDQIEMVLDRAVKRFNELAPPHDKMDRDEINSLRMDLCAVGKHCPMNWTALSCAPLTHLVHDVFGIRQHIDRSTGKLGGCFLPRYAKPRSPDIRNRIAGYVDAARRMICEWKACPFDAVHLDVKYGRTYAKIINYDGGARVYAFVCLIDVEIESHPHKAGDILMPKTFKTPAIHARGNVFDDDYGARFSTWHGPMYMEQVRAIQKADADAAKR